LAASGSSVINLNCFVSVVGTVRRSNMLMPFELPRRDFKRYGSSMPEKH
jgi:hypothetical protein